MFQDLDATLKELLIQKVPIDNTAIDIKFETPDKDWETKPAKPAINLFLYDVRENHELRGNESFLTRNGTSGTETSPPARIDLAYMITVWSRDVVDEHRLLGNILKTLLRYPILPTEVLRGDMSNQSLPLRAWIAQPEKTPNTWDFWGSREGRLKAGISYMVTIAVETSTPVEVSLVTEKVLKLTLLENPDRT